MSDTSSKNPTATPKPRSAGVQQWRPEQPLEEVRAMVDGKGNGEALPKELGGREGPEPTRFGDWEKNGRCIDF